MREKEVREQIYKALDQLELYDLSNVVETELNENGMDSTALFSCKDCAAEFGSCSDEQETTLDGQYICRARLYKHYGLQLS